ncbi:unnamed protein product [Phytomonas sp. Hart1]|nr:unnamed protein product [Phytomonas sp. Hart1]|eukprot:CCW70565.1 unnamed protein product [Phytomonas sp. isolate Hart1]
MSARVPKPSSKSSRFMPNSSGRTASKKPGSILPSRNAHTTAQGNDRKPLFSISEEHKLELRKAFDMFDTQGIGRIQAREVKVAFYALGYDVTDGELRQLLQDVHANLSDGDGMVDFNEFFSVLTRKMTSKESRIEPVRAFKQIDEDDKGYISLDDLRKIAQSQHLDLTDDELMEMILFSHTVPSGMQHSATMGGSSRTSSAGFDMREMSVVTEDEFIKLMQQAEAYLS